jgi:hypothetical protein
MSKLFEAIVMIDWVRPSLGCLTKRKISSEREAIYADYREYQLLIFLQKSVTIYSCVGGLLIIFDLQVKTMYIPWTSE